MIFIKKKEFLNFFPDNWGIINRNHFGTIVSNPTQEESDELNKIPFNCFICEIFGDKKAIFVFHDIYGYFLYKLIN